MESAPIVVWGAGPRVRIYCLYDEDAIIGEDANENGLPVDVTAGDWSMSLPCSAEDLDWVRAALAKNSCHVTARDMATELEVDATQNGKKSAIIDEEAFFRS